MHTHSGLTGNDKRAKPKQANLLERGKWEGRRKRAREREQTHRHTHTQTHTHRHTPFRSKTVLPSLSTVLLEMV